MSDLATRLRESRKLANIDQATIAKACGITRSAIAQWEAGDSRPSLENLKSVAALLGTTVGWLIGEKGAQSGRRERPPSRTTRAVPLITYQRAAVWKDEVIRRGKGLISFIHTDEIVSQRTFALKVKDRSMYPEFCPDDIVIVDPDVAPSPGDFVIAQGAALKEAVIRKYRPQATAPTEFPEVDLLPLNEDWPTIRLCVDNPGRIIGPVIELRRCFKTH